MIHEALRFLASTLDWHQVAETGWPLFRLLARLEQLGEWAGHFFRSGIKRNPKITHPPERLLRLETLNGLCKFVAKSQVGHCLAMG